jgi:hypothetical protein
MHCAVRLKTEEAYSELPGDARDLCRRIARDFNIWYKTQLEAEQLQRLDHNVARDKKD